MTAKLAIFFLFLIISLPAEDNAGIIIKFNDWKNKVIQFEKSKINIFFKDNELGTKTIVIIGTDKQNIGSIIFKDDDFYEYFIAGDNKVAISIKEKLIEIIGSDFLTEISINGDGVVAKEFINNYPIIVPIK